MNSAEVLITFKGDASGVNSATKSVEDSFNNLKKTGELALAGITTALDKMAISFIGAGIEYDAQIETYLTRLETLTGSAEEANKVLETIKKDALKTPFDVSSLTQAESLLLSTGLSADDARKDILALGDAVSASGGGNVELQRMAVNLQQIKNVGKASALDIKQFAYAGIDIYGLLADSMGVTREEASKMDITYDMLSKALQKASSEGGKYYGAMEKQSKTYNGAMSNLNESIQVLKGEVAKDLFNALKKIIPVINKFVDWLVKNHKIIKAIAVPLLVFFNTLMLFLGVAKIISLFKALWLVMINNPVGLTIAAIAALITIIIYLWNNCESFRNFITNTITVLKLVLEGIFKFVSGIIKGIWGTIKWLWDKLIGFLSFMSGISAKIIGFFLNLPGKMVKIGADIFNSLKKGAVDKWEGFKKWIGGIVEDIKGKFNWIDDFIGFGKDLIEGIKKGVKGAWDGAKNWFGDRANDIKNTFKKVFRIHSPSKVFADEIGANMVKGIQVGFSANMDKSSKKMLDSFNNAFALSPTLTGTANTHLSPTVNVVVNNNMKTDPLGQVVNKVKTFSGGAKNDYNYGYGG